VIAGFGISTPEQVSAILAAGADGVAVGSAAIDAADAGGVEALRRFVETLATGLG
jgi:tryptophan synthase alpha subunit